MSQTPHEEATSKAQPHILSCQGFSLQYILGQCLDRMLWQSCSRALLKHTYFNMYCTFSDPQHNAKVTAHFFVTLVADVFIQFIFLHRHLKKNYFSKELKAMNQTNQLANYLQILIRSERLKKRQNLINQEFDEALPMM